MAENIYYKKADETIPEYTARTGFMNSPITGATLQSQPDLSTSLPQAPTDTTNYQGIIAGGQTLADYFKTAGASLAEKPTDLTASFNKLYSDLGIGAKEEKAGESQKSLDLLNAQMAGLSAEAQGVPIRLQEESQGRGITTGGLAPLQAGELRKIALRSLPLQGQILAQQAVATGDQRALSAAQEKFNQSFQIVQKDEQRQYDFRKEQRDRIFDFLSNAEKEKLQALQKKDDREFTTMQNNLNFAQSLVGKAIETGQGDLAAKISSLDPKSKTYQQDIASLAGQIKTKTEGSGVLSVLDIARYKELYPEAGVIAGDSEATANAKVQALNTPETKLRNLVQGAKDNAASYEDVVKEIQSDTTIKDKETALAIAKEVFGISEGKQESAKGFPSAGQLQPLPATSTQLSEFGGGISDALSNFLFKPIE